MRLWWYSFGLILARPLPACSYIRINHNREMKKRGWKKREKKRGKKFGCKSHRLQAAESLFACSGLVQAAPLCTWIYYAIHVRVYINCYVETCTCALFVCAYTHTLVRVRAPWLSRGEHLRRSFLRRHRERTSKNSTLYDSRWIHGGLLRRTW